MSILSKARAVAVISLACVGGTLAQFVAPDNARIRSLAGARVNDISGIYRYPALMTGYLDHVQASWGSGFGGFIGVKSVTDMFSIGVLANQGPMDRFFTEAAARELNTYFGQAYNYDFVPLPGDIERPTFQPDPNVTPHLLLGLSFGAISIGADIFFEYLSYSASYDEGYSETTPRGAGEYSASMSNIGARLSGKVSLPSVDIMAKFGFGIPSVGAEGPPFPVTPPDTLIPVMKLSSEEGLYLETGAEATLPIGSIDLTLGLDYTGSSYQFKVGDTLRSGSTVYNNSLLNIYTGMEFNFAETAVAALGYSLTRYAHEATTTTIIPIPRLDAIRYERVETEVRYAHTIYAAVENAWDKAWVFDSFFLRGGAYYTIGTSGWNTSTPSIPAIPPATTPTLAKEAEFSQPAIHSAVTPIIGIGVSKAFATIDLALEPGNWLGVFTGPAVAMATATVKF
jgi:hypothetical protein